MEEVNPHRAFTDQGLLYPVDVRRPVPRPEDMQKLLNHLLGGLVKKPDEAQKNEK
jgi:hypothetical protein